MKGIFLVDELSTFVHGCVGSEIYEEFIELGKLFMIILRCKTLRSYLLYVDKALSVHRRIIFMVSLPDSNEHETLS